MEEERKKRERKRESKRGRERRRSEIAGSEGRRERRRVVRTSWIPGMPEVFYDFLYIFPYVCPPHAHVRTDVSSPSALQCSTLYDLKINTVFHYIIELLNWMICNSNFVA
jgi:hypothetical protein